MYLTFYNWAMHLFGTSLGLVGQFNDKLKAGYVGRKNLFERLASTIQHDKPIIWFHAASLGEAEQGVPIMEATSAQYPNHRILLTFFSPSGMEHFKRKDLADYVFYLPFDTRANAKKFLNIVKPDLTFFIKYEIWPNFFREIQARNIPMIIAPAVFLPEFFYFKKPHSNHFLPLLRKADQILVQDENSKKLLADHQIDSKVCGDSRFDRVLQNTEMPFDDVVLQTFTKNKTTLIGGSTWQKDETLIASVLEKFPEVNLVVAPHDISKENIARVEKLFRPFDVFRYSEAKGDFAKNRVCIIDNIGLLSRLYRYGQLAYIGGAFGKGIHNSLEAAAYGLPLFFGPNHQAFIEPSLMLKQGFAFEVHHEDDLLDAISPLLQHPEKLETLQNTARQFVKNNAGSVDKIMQEVNRILPKA